MENVNNVTYLDYNEAATALHCKYNYIRELVSNGKLKSRNLGFSKRKYIALPDIEAFLGTSNTAPSVPVPFPIESQALKAIEQVQQGYSKLSEDYKTSLEPLIRTVKDTDTEAFINSLQQVIAMMMNRLYALPSDKPIQSMTPYELFMYLVQDTDIPENVKHHLINGLLNTVNEALAIDKAKIPA